MPNGYQRVVPYLGYVDAPAALDFLCHAFGFQEAFRYPMDDGRIGHAELILGGDVALMVASTFPEFGLLSPRNLPGVHSQVKCFVDDVDAHYRTALEAGATIVSEPKDEYGERGYRAVDLEGHRWMFGQILPQDGES